MKKFLFAILICAMPFILTGCGEKDLSVMDNVEVTFEGLNGEGTASCSINWADLEKEVSEDSNHKLSEIFNIYIIENLVEANIDGKDSGLSNGDTVSVKITCDEKALSKNGFKLSGETEKSFKVKGLKEIEEIDAFDKDKFNVKSGDGVYIEFIGVSPDASVQIRNTLPLDDPMSQINYIAEPSTGIKFGDSIKIKAELPYNYQDDYTLKSEYTNVTCESVDRYIESIDEIDDETWEKIKKQCNDIKTAKIDNFDGISYTTDDIYSWMGSFEVQDFKWSNVYLSSQKDGAQLGWGEPHNQIALTYLININYQRDDINKTIKQACGALYIDDLVKTADGEVTFTIDMIRLDQDVFVSEDTFKKECVNNGKDVYEITEKRLEW